MKGQLLLLFRSHFSEVTKSSPLQNHEFDINLARSFVNKTVRSREVTQIGVGLIYVSAKQIRLVHSVHGRLDPRPPKRGS